jgi:very-short-patch-repair endonuclease
MTYPEKVAYDWFVGKKIHFQHNQKVDRYYPDFVVGTKVIIEIDGEYWHDDANDNKRDSVLASLGYTIYRIKAKENIEKRLEEIFNNM